MSRIQDLVVEHAPDLAALTPARTGNLSVRDGDRYAVTPTGIPYDAFSADDVPVLTLDGEQVAGDLAPSSEVPTHGHLYRDREPGAIVHIHGAWTTTLAILHEEIPAEHYMIAPMGDRIPVADYATYGTEELGDSILAAMDDADASACIMANHGAIVTADDLPTALERAEILEHLARIHCQARSIGDTHELSRDELARVRDKFDRYGQGDHNH